MDSFRSFINFEFLFLAVGFYAAFISSKLSVTRTSFLVSFSFLVVRRPVVTILFLPLRWRLLSTSVSFDVVVVVVVADNDSH